MRVDEICTRDVKTCGPDTNLADAAWTMWEADCGILPVVDAEGKVTGVVTDRDIAMATATKYRPAREIAVREVTADRLFTCSLRDDVKEALETMRSQKIRRLPVVDTEGKARGMLSLNDVAQASRPGWGAKTTEVTYEDLALALKAIGEPRSAERGAAEPRSLICIDAE
jgi:CBS domain-containing protein